MNSFFLEREVFLSLLLLECFNSATYKGEDLDRYRPGEQKPLMCFQLTAQEDLFRAPAAVKQHERRLLCPEGHTRDS